MVINILIIDRNPKVKGILTLIVYMLTLIYNLYFWTFHIAFSVKTLNNVLTGKNSCHYQLKMKGNFQFKMAGVFPGQNFA